MDEKDSIKYASGIFAIKPKPIDWSCEKIVSFSQFSSFNSCPKKWALRYIHRHKLPSESIDLVYGTAVHYVIQLYIKTMFLETIKKANELDLNDILLNKLKSEYKLRVEINGGHFSTPTELATYYSYGVEVLNYLKKHRAKYFTTKNTKLIGIELPISTISTPDRPFTRLECHLDLVLYNTVIDKYSIIDFKTSRRGWNEYKKKDKNTTNQLVLYKKFFCETYNIDYDKVDVQYFILKSEIDANSLWPQKRIQEFNPSHGKISMGNVYKEFKLFIESCFNRDGTYNINRNYPAFASKGGYNCSFCPYLDRDDLCPKNNRIT